MFTGFCGVDILRLAVKSTLKVTNSLHTLPPPALTSHSPTSYSHIPLSRLLLLPLTSHPPNSYSHFQRSQC